MSTPSDKDVSAPVDARQIVRDLANKHGVRPLDHTGPMQVLDPLQADQARGFVQFKSHDDQLPDDVIAKKGARILLARAGAMLREKVWGLTPDSNDPGAADFSDVALVLDDVAKQIHTPARYGNARHAG